MAEPPSPQKLLTRARVGVAHGALLAALFAVLVTALGNFDLLIPSWTPTLGRAAAVTLRTPYAPRIHTDGDRFRYEHARIIVPRGTVLSEANNDHRAVFAHESLRRPGRPLRVAAEFAVNFGMGLALTAYLRRFGQNRVKLMRTQVGLFTIMLGVLALEKALLLYTALPEGYVPVAAAPLWVALSFDRRTAFLVNVVLAFVAASLLRYDILFLTLLLFRGMAASVLFFSVKRPQQMVTAGFFAGCSSVPLYVAVGVVLEGAFDVRGDLARGVDSTLLSCVGGGLLAGVLANLLREPAARVLGHVSRDQLLWLTDLEQPLLQKMASEAPGSWAHARAMANLAEAAASAIGADALLTRAGAYYHDLGKTLTPKHFIENLEHEEKSPHEALDPMESAVIIRRHVTEGTRILREGGIPEPVVEFCYTHHGTQAVEYFFHKAKEQGNPHGYTEDDFRYPGMKPQTKETAILMLVDSIEAASRTIDPPERAKYEQMIDRIIVTKLRAGQLDESGLSMEDLRSLAVRMGDTLVNVYHSRIKYPWQRGDRESALGRAAKPAARAK
ncbi:MAG: HDIG domain-containing protein [Polyangiaceae bacterium]|nr:HDIG domain-containing protein [Polyangiaceae bacterium]